MMSKTPTPSSKKRPRHGGGLAAWSIRHPIGVVMIALAVIILGLFALGRLAIDLLPHLIYPEIRVRIIDPGVPATIMEDRVTRQLEEQLAITEDAIGVQSTTAQGLATVDLSFAYGKDIDVALRDASTRLDRAKRFLPESIDPPVIYKRDPSQIPVAEFVVSSSLRESVELRTWVDDVFSKMFINLPGVAAVEVGGGLVREIQVLPDQQRLAALGLKMQDLVDALQRGNREDPAGRLEMTQQQITGRISGRLANVEQIRSLPLTLADGSLLYLHEVAEVRDTHEDERLRVRADGVPGVKVSIQKQPKANTVAVVESVQQRMHWLNEQQLLPPDISLTTVSDQSIYIRQSLNNSVLAAVSGAVLAMTVVYLFLGNLRRTLIIGSAIPLAIMVTFILMGLSELTLNVMILGGLALGVGLLVDNTIVMLENIYRHQRENGGQEHSAIEAAAEVNSAIVAATSTNLSAILPFLFIGGLIGLLFRELIFTISAAVFASMIIALTLVPALAVQVRSRKEGRFRRRFDNLMRRLQGRYAGLVSRFLNWRWPIVVLFGAALALSLPTFFSGKQEFLPKLDDGLITVVVVTDPGVTLEEMDQRASVVEKLMLAQPETANVFTLVGGSIFGRTEREIPNRATLKVQLRPLAQRKISSQVWIKRMQKEIAARQLAGVKVRMYQRGIRGIRTSRGDDDISLRIQGPEIPVLEQIADGLLLDLADVQGLRNLGHSLEEDVFELSIEIDRIRAASLGLEVEDISLALRVALEGMVVSDFIDGDRAYDIRLRLPHRAAADPGKLDSLLLFPAQQDRPAVHLADVADIRLINAPATIMRDNQMRIIEISASIADDHTLGKVLGEIATRLDDLALPDGYTLYEGGAREALQAGQRLTVQLMALALFLVFVVMAVQYESLRNPLVIILGAPFAVIGVAAGIHTHGLTLSMPVWLGMIMLTGIVVNNAIVLVEYIEIMRDKGLAMGEAIVQGAYLRLRPILMTTLTTVVGMLPLALGLGEGAEMLKPLAVTIVWGLSFSMLVSLVLIPVFYQLLHRRGAA